MSSCTPFTNNLNMWSPMSSIYFDQQPQYHHRHTNSSNNVYNNNHGSVITQAVASPTLKYTVYDFDDYYGTDESRYFHHEPVLYPSACIVCGLAHHPVPHTVLNEEHAHQTYLVESTPAPNTAGPSSFLPKKKNQLNHLKTSSHDLDKKVVSRNKRQGWGVFVRGLFYRWLSVYQNSIRPSHSDSRRHNVYPVLKNKKEQRMA